MISLVGDVFTAVLLAGFVLVAAVFVTRVVAHVRLHHALANRRFMRRHRAEHSRDSRTTVEAPTPPPTLPVVRPHSPAGAGGAPTSASAGPTRGHHTR